MLQAQPASSVDVSAFILPVQRLAQASVSQNDSLSDSCFESIAEPSSSAELPRKDNVMGDCLVGDSSRDAAPRAGHSNGISHLHVEHEHTETNLQDIFAEVCSMQNMLMPSLTMVFLWAGLTSRLRHHMRPQRLWSGYIFRP